MSRPQRRASPLRDKAAASKSPQRSSTKTDNHIGVTVKNLSTQAIEFRFELCSDVALSPKFRVSTNSDGLVSAEELEIVARRMLLEDIGTIYLWVTEPDLGGMARVFGGVELAKELLVDCVDRDQLGGGHHPEEFGSGD